MFKYPIPDADELAMLYREGSGECWEDPVETRHDWVIARDWIWRTVERGDILDVGCWDGSFLASLQKEDNYGLHGVELNDEAVGKAGRMGIDIVSPDFSTLRSLGDASYDVVCAFDVIEHTENPALFLKTLSNLTRPDGYLIISSGNTEASAWRFSRSRYWYCSIPEHISFINRTWCTAMCGQIGCSLEKIELYSHLGRVSRKEHLRDFVKNLLYAAVPSLFVALRNFRWRQSKVQFDEKYSFPPAWASSKDHLIAVYRKHDA